MVRRRHCLPSLVLHYRTPLGAQYPCPACHTYLCAHIHLGGFTPHLSPYKEQIVNDNHRVTALSRVSQGGHSRSEVAMPHFLGKQRHFLRNLSGQHTLLCLAVYLQEELRWAYLNRVLNDSWHWDTCAQVNGRRPELSQLKPRVDVYCLHRHSHYEDQGLGRTRGKLSKPFPIGARLETGKAVFLLPPETSCLTWVDLLLCCPTTNTLRLWVVVQ